MFVAPCYIKIVTSAPALSKFSIWSGSRSTRTFLPQGEKPLPRHDSLPTRSLHTVQWTSIRRLLLFRPRPFAKRRRSEYDSLANKLGRKPIKGWLKIY